MDKYKIYSLFLFFTYVLATEPSSLQKELAKDLVKHQTNEQVTSENINKTTTDTNVSSKNKLNKLPKEKDLQGSAAEYGEPNFAHPSDVYGFFPSKDCHSCNDQPWVPIYGRSLAIPQHNEFHPDANQDFHDKTSNFHPFYPNLDEYSAPQSGYDYPRPGEVVEFMLPPPLSLRKPFTSFGGHDKPPSGLISSGFGDSLYPSSFRRNRRPQSFKYSSLSQDMVPPPYAPSFNSYPTNFGNQHSLSSSHYFKEGLRPDKPQPYPQTSLSFEGHPGVGKLPLSYSNFNLQNPVPSDSYGQPLVSNYDSIPFNPLPTLSQSLQIPSAGPSGSYGSPIPRFDSVTSAQQTLPFGWPSNSYNRPATGEHLKHFEANGLGETLRPPHIEGVKATLFKSGATDVQVVPSVKIADYTASVEHPINLIQSPILDVVAKNQILSDIVNHNYETAPNYSKNTHSKHNVVDLDVATNNDNFKLSEKPTTVVKNDDSFSSASSVVNSTVPSTITTIKRHNDKYLSTDQNNINVNENVNWFKNMILENNKGTTDKKSIVAIKKMIIDPSKIKANLKIAQPNVDVSSWRSIRADNNNIVEDMLPPKPQSSAWTNFVENKTKNKPIQIIVPYVRDNVSRIQNHSNEYTTLRSTIEPPSFNAEPSLWPKYSVDQNSKQSSKVFEKTTQVYNIKDFISENAHKPADLPLPFDIISLQKNIDKWTHQSYSNIKGYGAVKGVESEDKQKADEYLKKDAQDKNVFKVYSTEKNEPDPIVGSGSEKIEETVSYNDINYDDLSNDIDDTDSNNNDDYSMENNDIKTTTSNKQAESSSYPTIRFGVKQERQTWNFVKETKSNATQEKVYVVTPQSYAFVTSTPATAFSMAPKIQDGKVNKNPIMTKISVRVERDNATTVLGKNAISGPVKVVYSEWPHIINNLETTTTLSPVKTSSRHPLFGLIDIPAYTPSNSTVETIGGHSKVNMVVTPPTKSASSTSKFRS